MKLFFLSMFAPRKARKPRAGRPRGRRAGPGRLQVNVPYPNASTLDTNVFPRTKSRYAITNKSTIKALLRPLGFTRVTDAGYEIFTRLLDQGVKMALEHVTRIRDATKKSSTFGTSQHVEHFMNHGGVAARQMVPDNVTAFLGARRADNQRRGQQNFANMGAAGKMKMTLYRLLPPFIKLFYKEVKVILHANGFSSSNLSIMDSCQYFNNNNAARNAVSNYYNLNPNELVCFHMANNGDFTVHGSYALTVLKYVIKHKDDAKKKERQPLSAAEYGWLVLWLKQSKNVQAAQLFSKMYFQDEDKAPNANELNVKNIYDWLPKTQLKTFKRLMTYWGLNNGVLSLVGKPGDINNYEAYFNNKYLRR